MVQEINVENIIHSIFQDWSVLMNYEHHGLGRIWVLWRDNVRLTPMFKSDQMITCSVALEGREEEIICSFIYASNSMEERHSLWEDIKSHERSPIVRNKPWLLCGDLNETLEGDEHSNYATNLITTVGMREFQEVVRVCLDLGYQGPLFTWCNKREEDLICKKLDRVLVNEKWTEAFPLSYSIFEAGGCSDQLRCKIIIEVQRDTGRKPFKFTNALAKLPQFLPVVENFWTHTEPLFISTSALFRFSKKINALKPYLRYLGKETMADIIKRTKEAYEILFAKQAATLSNPDQIGREECFHLLETIINH